jgi:hypothetical protein
MKLIRHASLIIFLSGCHGLSLETRRSVIGWMGSASAGLIAANANAAETTDVDNYLRSGMVSMPMGVSGKNENGFGIVISLNMFGFLWKYSPFVPTIHDRPSRQGKTTNRRCVPGWH